MDQLGGGGEDHQKELGMKKMEGCTCACLLWLCPVPVWPGLPGL